MELTEEQLHEAVWFYDRDAKRSTKLRLTDALIDEYKRWLLAVCEHSSFGIFRHMNSSGGDMFRRECASCGFADGQWIKRQKVENADQVPLVAGDRHQKYLERRRLEWSALQQPHLARQQEEGGAAYESYLQSSEWSDKRQKVLGRANGICEGCLERPATQVHHLTYDHAGNEFLWELVAICNQCHDRFHDDDKK